jgi:hypothetical protein
LDGPCLLSISLSFQSPLRVPPLAQTSVSIGGGEDEVEVWSQDQERAKEVGTVRSRPKVSSSGDAAEEIQSTFILVV